MSYAKTVGPLECVQKRLPSRKQDGLGIKSKY
jgi:hypothetical protein